MSGIGNLKAAIQLSAEHDQHDLAVAIPADQDPISLHVQSACSQTARAEARKQGALEQAAFCAVGLLHVVPGHLAQLLCQRCHHHNPARQP